MTSEEFHKFGEALFGQRWQSELGRSLGIGDRHIRRLAAGQAPVTERLAAELIALARQRVGGIQQVIAEYRQT